MAILALQQQSSDNCDKAPASSEDSSNFVPVSLVVLPPLGGCVCVCVWGQFVGFPGQTKTFQLLLLSLSTLCVALKLLGFSRTENVVKSIKRAATWPEPEFNQLFKCCGQKLNLLFSSS